jgi:hypothetical protein
MWIEFGNLGVRGDLGFSGSIGYVGSVGAGYTGSKGYAGSLGYTGGIGYSGSLGYFGSFGYSGSVGYAGSLGYSGSIGPDGPTGVVRNVVNGTTVTLTPNQTTSALNITGYKSYVLFKIVTSAPSWVRIYTDDASRTLDISRAITTDPDLGSGLISEVLTNTGHLTQLITPAVFGFNNDSPPSTNLYLTVTNKDTVSRNISVYLTLLQMER